ncbi:hypothetical protein QWY97_10515 [Vibrio cortegadensis]|uniref:hypothetical protein n=1 Tax=Vibrio cortegadensis TaxID=1328770 RepID=UPI0021C4BFFD|nr:hypothetical protein [Vibrio cortegadensis]MDN3697778.1 hypothetical protein [Vibrio cortegadensis]
MLGSLTSLTGGGGFTGGSAGPSTAANTTNAGQSVGGISMGGSKGAKPWLLLSIVAVIALVALKR